MSADGLTRDAELVNEGRRFQADLGCKGWSHRGDLDGRPGESLIDASGPWLPPSMIDDPVHFREPGLSC
jgi:dihydroorotase